MKRKSLWLDIPKLQDFQIGIENLVFSLVEKYTGIRKQVIQKKIRNASIVAARQIFCFLMDKYNKLHHLEIGLIVGLDRSTVAYSIKRVIILREIDKSFRATLNKITSDLERNLNETNNCKITIYDR